MDQLTLTDRAVSVFLGDPPSSPVTISIWSPLQLHLSGLHQVAFLQISKSCTHVIVTAHWAFCGTAPCKDKYRLTQDFHLV